MRNHVRFRPKPSDGHHWNISLPSLPKQFCSLVRLEIMVWTQYIYIDFSYRTKMTCIAGCCVEGSSISEKMEKCCFVPQVPNIFDIWTGQCCFYIANAWLTSNVCYIAPKAISGYVLHMLVDTSAFYRCQTCQCQGNVPGGGGRLGPTTPVTKEVVLEECQQCWNRNLYCCVP